MRNRPISAFGLSSSQSQQALQWRSLRPTTANCLVNMKKLEEIEISFDGEHANLPRETLGSRLSLTIPRPQSALTKPKPAFKVNTQVLSKEFTQIPYGNKAERQHLAQKLKKLCKTRSSQLFEEAVKPEKVEIFTETLASQVKRLWQDENLQEFDSFPSSHSEIKPLRPQSAYKKPQIHSKQSHIFIPSLNRPNSASFLTVIPEKTHASTSTFPIIESDYKFYKKACDLKVFTIDLNDKINNNGFKGKRVRTKKLKIPWNSLRSEKVSEEPS